MDTIFPIIPAVNYHLWEPCNMQCKFCYATFKDIKQQILPKRHLPEHKSKEIVRLLAEYGFEKINFAGGEPTLCPFLPRLLEEAQSRGMKTAIVTNGIQLLDTRYWEAISPNLNWLGLSVDTLDEQLNREVGRADAKGRVLTGQDAAGLIKQAKDVGIRTKINTVIYKQNLNQNMYDFILKIKPDRFKILQCLPIKGKNDMQIQDFLISDTEFEAFVSRHKAALADSGIEICPETHDDLTGSYAMVDPAGQFFDNVDGKLLHSRPILEVGVKAAISEVRIMPEKFNARGGNYNF